MKGKRFAALAAAAMTVGVGTACATMDGGASAGLTQAERASLAAAIAAPGRTPANIARDRYRHPAETLAFFGVRPGQTVVEIWPGGGWYTEILAPYLRAGGGTYVAAAPAQGVARLTTWRDTNQARVGSFPINVFPTFEPGQPAVAPGSADVVLTFRNVHNWRIGSGRDGQDYSAEAFRQLYAMLKPGGVLGIVDHRLPEGADAERERTSGYMKVSTVRALAEQAGFRFDGSSEINANPADTADWPQGVWTLPPTLRLGEQDRARYQAIGESDRMTLRFVKPR